MHQLHVHVHHKLYMGSTSAVIALHLYFLPWSYYVHSEGSIVVGATVGFAENTMTADVIVNDVQDEVAEEFAAFVHGSLTVAPVEGA